MPKITSTKYNTEINMTFRNKLRVIFTLNLQKTVHLTASTLWLYILLVLSTKILNEAII